MKMRLLSFIVFIGLASSHVERGLRKMYATKQREYETLKLKYIDNPECTDADLMDAARGLANVVDDLNRKEGIDPSQDSRWYAQFLKDFGKSRTAHQWMEFVDELVAANTHFDPIIEIIIITDHENKVTYRINQYPFAPFEFVERNEELGIIHGDGELIPTETFKNAVKIIRGQQLCSARYFFFVEIDFGKIGKTMENAKLCYLPKQRCSQDVKVENGKVGDV